MLLFSRLLSPVLLAEIHRPGVSREGVTGLERCLDSNMLCGGAHLVVIAVASIHTAIRAVSSSVCSLSRCS